MQEKSYRVSGRVQGVGFRWWTRQEATELGLEGAVRNRRDGTVEVRVRGPEDRVAEFRVRLEEGPRSARVETVRECSAGLPMTDGEFLIVR